MYLKDARPGKKNDGIGSRDVALPHESQHRSRRPGRQEQQPTTKEEARSAETRHQHPAPRRTKKGQDQDPNTQTGDQRTRTPRKTTTRTARKLFPRRYFRASGASLLLRQRTGGMSAPLAQESFTPFPSLFERFLGRRPNHAGYIPVCDEMPGGKGRTASFGRAWTATNELSLSGARSQRGSCSQAVLSVCSQRHSGTFKWLSVPNHKRRLTLDEESSVKRDHSFVPTPAFEDIQSLRQNEGMSHNASTERRTRSRRRLHLTESMHKGTATTDVKEKSEREEEISLSMEWPLLREAT